MTAVQDDHSQPPASDQQLLLDFIATRDVPCPACAYNLRGLTASTCPECGHELHLQVGTAAGLATAWITMLVALLLPAGPGLFCLVALTVALVSRGSLDISGSGSEEVMLLLVFIYLIAAVPFSTLAIGLRKWFMPLKPNTQNILAALVIGCDILVLALFIAAIR